LLRLGWRFANGRGVPQDNGQAYFWLTLAARNGNKGADKLRASLAAGMAPGDVTKLDQSAQSWQESRKVLAHK